MRLPLPSRTPFRESAAALAFAAEAQGEAATIPEWKLETETEVVRCSGPASVAETAAVLPGPVRPALLAVGCSAAEDEVERGRVQYDDFVPSASKLSAPAAESRMETPWASYR